MAQNALIMAYIMPSPLESMITGQQIRSARAALNWPRETLAEYSGVSLRTLMRLEQTDSVPASRASTLMEIQRAFEAAGIEFIGSPDDRPESAFRGPPPSRSPKQPLNVRSRLSPCAASASVLASLSAI